jgi:hypothetical protein
MVIKGYIIYIYISSEYSHAPYVNSCVAFSVNMTIKKSMTPSQVDPSADALVRWVSRQLVVL